MAATFALNDSSVPVEEQQVLADVQDRLSSFAAVPEPPLDALLPTLVERLVRAEIERVARGR